ncbi:MAG: glycosyltransferase family 4 protein [Prosthecobacter sp.]
MKIVVLFDHFGPYHLARLGGLSGAANVLGIELYGKSHDYAWEASDRGAANLVTLAEQGSAFRMTSAELAEKLSAALDDFQPDAVAIPGWSSKGALTALKWCLAHRIPAILMTESSAHDERRQSLKEWVKRRLIRLFSASLAGGTLHRDYLVALGMDRESIFLGYDAIDNEYFRQRADAIRLVSLRDTEEECFLASARFIPKKNIIRLIKAYAGYRIVASSLGLRPWSLVLLGDGQMKAEIVAEVNRLKLESFVTMPGFKQYNELPEYYARSSAFIHASTTEQWGLVVNEAMACGLPVLVSNRCGCAPDLVREGVNGLTFDPHDCDAIARCMLQLTQLPAETREKMGAASVKMIGHWGPERFAEGLLKSVEFATVQERKTKSILDRILLALLSRK